MNNEKILEEFDREFVKDCGPDVEPIFICAVGSVGPIRRFLTNKLDQARAEVGAMVRGEIERLATCSNCNGTGMKGCDVCGGESHGCTQCSETGEIDIHKDDLLSSLDKSDKNKCPKCDGWLKKWFDRQIFTGMHCGNCGYFSTLDKLTDKE